MTDPIGKYRKVRDIGQMIYHLFKEIILAQGYQQEAVSKRIKNYLLCIERRFVEPLPD